ncbi:MAG: glycine cleavage system protein H, partial [Actinobacteria bacterium]|nr:glycine cleavage system protein H [Actinomycetota bacterium]
LDGEVIETNSAVVDAPETVNSDPFGNGWLIKVRFTSLPQLLTAAEYDALTGEG